MSIAKYTLSIKYDGEKAEVVIDTPGDESDCEEKIPQDLTDQIAHAIETATIKTQKTLGRSLRRIIEEQVYKCLNKEDTFFEKFLFLTTQSLAAQPLSYDIRIGLGCFTDEDWDIDDDDYLGYEEGEEDDYSYYDDDPYDPGYLYDHSY